MSNPRNLNQVLQGATATARAALPAVPATRTKDPVFNVFMAAVKERMEVREGQRGNPFERVVTARELDELGLIRTPPMQGTVQKLSGIVAQTGDGQFVLVSLEDLAKAIQDLLKLTSSSTNGGFG